MESDFGPQPFIFCNNLADRKQRVAKSKGEEQGSRDEQTPDAGEGSAEGEGIEGKVEDKQGNPINADGSLVLESVNNVSDMTDNDFTNPTRNVKLPILPEKVSDAIGANGRPIVIKKNIFERNKKKHKDLTPEQSREILKSALYNPDLYGQNQKAKRPYNWIVINTKDENGRNRSVVIEISPDEMRDTALKELDAEQQLKSEEVTAATEKFLSADSEEERQAEEEARKAYEAKIAEDKQRVDEDRQKRITVTAEYESEDGSAKKEEIVIDGKRKATVITEGLNNENGEIKTTVAIEGQEFNSLDDALKYVDENPLIAEYIPRNDAGEPDFEAVEPTKAADGLIEFSGNSVESARNIADAQVAQAKAELDELAKKAPMKGKVKLSGSPIAMIKQQKQADEIYKQQKAEHDQQLEAAQKRYTHWQSIQNDIKTRQESARHEQALAEDAERKRKKAELKAEQERGVEVVTGKQLENEILENKGKEAETSQDVSVYSLTADEAQDFISNMELSADEAPEIDLTIENWDALFGEDGIVNTPIGDVKMGENQFAKMMRQGRDGKLGMIKPTLESPYVIIEDASKAKDGDTTERASSYIFIRSFKKADGSRYYYFTSVTVSKDGKEVVVSSQEKSRKRILRLLQEGNVIWRTPKDATTISAKRQGLDYEQTDKAETATKGSGITPQSTPSESKGTNKSETLQEGAEKSVGGEGETSLSAKIEAASAEVNTEPTEAQKEAGNYMKGHVQVGTFDITIEQPQGSVRKGMDADGKQWESKMNNTYGYIRGTEGVDGDHIDVFLSNDIDGWDGRKVFVVDQYNPDGSFDEHKVMLGFNDADEAKSDYLANYESGWENGRRIDVSAVNLEDFEKWIESSKRKTKPFSEYKSVKSEKQENEGGVFDIPHPELGRSDKRLLMDEGRTAYSMAGSETNPFAGIGDDSTGFREQHFERFCERYKEFVGDFMYKKHEKYLRDFFDYFEKSIGGKVTSEKGNSASDNTTDTVGTAEGGKRNDTATPQNTVSAGKDKEKGSSEQENAEKKAVKAAQELDRLNEEKKKISEELGKAIGDNDRDAESRLWKEDRAIDEKKREVVSKLSDEELSEIRHYDEANDELKRREAKKADDEFIEKSAEAQGDDVRVKPKNKKTTIHSFSAGKKGQVRPQLYGVYHSPDGAAVSTDASVLVVSKSAYDKSKKGKIVDKDGKEIIGKYPDYRKVLPKENSPVKVDYDDMLSFVSGAIERYEAADKWNKRYPENVQVVLRLPDGRRVVINAYTLEKFIRGAKMTGADNIDTDVDPLRPITARSKDGEVCSMPVNLRREDGKPGEDVFVYDVKGGENNGIKEHRGEEATAVSEEDAAMRDVLVDKMKESGIDVVTDSEGGQKILDMANDVRLSKDKKRALETASVTSDEAHQPTVVSSADGAKVLKNLDNLATEYEEKTGRPKTLLGDVAEAIGAEKHGSNSQYATFECKNGNVVTIRLANHNAAVSTFDNHGESEGISIVVSPKKNAGVKKDGNAHVTEFFYDAILLRRAEGKPLAEIIRSIQQALYSGKFEDKTGLAQREEVNGDDIIRYHKVYHGSGADFDEFDHSHIGEGEGAQAFGWGTYLTEVKGIGEGYARKMANGRITPYDVEEIARNIMLEELQKLLDTVEDGYEDVGYNFDGDIEDVELCEDESTLKEWRNFFLNSKYEWMGKRNLSDYDLDNDKDLAEFRSDLKYSIMEEIEKIESRYHSYIDNYKYPPKRAPYLYTVEVPDDNGKNFLHWESQTPSETVEKIRDYVREHCSEEVAEEFDKQIAYGTDNPDLAEYGQNGENVYKAVEYALGSDKKASLVLSELGMQGISYQADFMRGGRADGARNYVIFKEEDAKITDKVRLFKTKNGKAYGFTVGGKIYVDPRIAKADTPIHEYSHLWASMFRDVNPKEWSNVVKLMKDTPLWEEIRKKYPELETDEEIADEVLAHFSGKRGAERLRQAQQEAMKEKGVSAKASAISAIERVRKALSTFWKGVCDLLHIHFTSAEEVADRVLSDMLNGVDPVKVKNEAKKGEGNLHYRMGDSTQTFAERQRKAVENRGTVMPALNEAEVKVVEVPKHSYKGTIKEATERAIESAKAKYVPNGEPKILHYNNYGTSFDYVISKRAIQICLSPTHQSKSVNKGSHLALADHLDEIINNSIEVEEHPDYTKDENGVRGNGINSNALMHRFYGAVTIDGKQYRVITLMREDSNVNEGNGIHSYEVQTIEVLNNELPSTSNGADSHHQSKTDLTYRIANLLSGVEKSYDKGKKLLEESKSLTDIKYRTSSEIDAEYPNWLEGTTNDNGKHTTQIAGTVKTYQKVGKWIESHLGKDIRILDASSGMGYGTADLKEQGFNIEDVEPYQSEDRKKNNPATYSSYGDIEGKYDYIISNAVLNVVPDDWRSDILHDMAARLNEGGKLFINTRKAGEEKSIKDKIELDSPQEVLVKRNGHIASYQKFFTPQELKEWVEKELGDGYTVEIANEENSGTKGLAAVVVTKTKATSATDPESKTSRATEISEHLNTPVRVITSEKEMEGLSPRQKKVKGWYNTATGEVVVVVPNNADVADVENTVLHEVIGHDGIRDFRL